MAGRIPAWFTSSGKCQFAGNLRAPVFLRDGAFAQPGNTLFQVRVPIQEMLTGILAAHGNRLEIHKKLGFRIGANPFQDNRIESSAQSGFESGVVGSPPQLLAGFSNLFAIQKEAEGLGVSNDNVDVPV